MADYIFTMQDLMKVHPPDKKVVEDLPHRRYARLDGFQHCLRIP